MAQRSFKIKVSEKSGSVSAIWMEPSKATCALVFAHGAGADMKHVFMETVAKCLADERIATLRFNFPYMEAGKRSPDPKSVLMTTIRGAVEKGKSLSKLPIILGGKSLGGRMASWVVAEGIHDVKGLVFFGFPLHAPGRASTERADHLTHVKMPMLFLQGTRDSLANNDSIKAVSKSLGRIATLQIIEGGNHSFKVPAKMQVSYEKVMKGLAAATGKWAKQF